MQRGRLVQGEYFFLHLIKNEMVKSSNAAQKFLLFVNLMYYCAGIRLVSHP